MKLPHVLIATRWNSWFNAAKYYSSFAQFCEGFFKLEKSHGIAVDKILELVDDDRLNHVPYHNLRLNLHFIIENCTCLITVLISLEETKTPITRVIYNLIADIKQYSFLGTSKSTFGVEIDRLLFELENRGRDLSQISKICSAHLFQNWLNTWMPILCITFTRDLICLILESYLL